MARPGPPVPASGDGWTVVINMPMKRTRRGYAPVGWLNLNDKRHPVTAWKIARAWREAAHAALLAKRLPKGLGRVRIQVELRFPDAIIRDASNYQQIIKPCIDAVQPQKVEIKTDPKTGGKKTVVSLGVGLVAGDDKRYVDQPEPVIGDPLGRTNPIKGQVILHIVPLQEEATA